MMIGTYSDDLLTGKIVSTTSKSTGSYRTCLSFPSNSSLAYVPMG